MITEISDAVGESGRGRQARSPRPVGDSRTGRDCHDAVRVGAMAETILGRPVLLSESAGRYLVPGSVKSILAYASAE